MTKIKNKIESTDEFITEQLFGIYGRSYLTTAILLAYCSALRFTFQGQILPRGWLDIIIFGDSRCGKSHVAEGLYKSLKMGEMFSCENSSFVGLVGGLQQLGSRSKWDIVWGKIPLNTGRLLIADELSSMKVDDIGRMSSVRSSGVAEINKVQHGITRAQTRLVWLSNPREGGKMSSYTFGMTALAELMGRMEDIARFDFAVAVNTSDVPVDITNMYREVKEVYYDWNPLRHLIRWAWRLRPQDIVFPIETTKTVLELASRQSKSYTSKIPLVEPNEQRVKLARVSAAVAVRCFSEKEGKLIVKPEHVEYADYFMSKMFDSKALGYKLMSISEQQDEVENVESVGIIRRVLEKYGAEYNRRAIKLLYNSDQIGLSDLSNIFNVSTAEAREIISVLLRFGCIIRQQGFYKKTPTGIAILEGILQ